MVRAILDGRKTVTRRIVKPQPDFVVPQADSSKLPVVGKCTPDDEKHGRLAKSLWCPYGHVGDRLWVRETHMRVPHPAEFGFTKEMLPHTWDACCEVAGTFLYRADPCSDLVADGRQWTPSIHMPRAASRITLEVTGVRVERLQAITHEQAVAEGVHRIDIGSGYRPRYSAAQTTWQEVVEGTADAYEDARLAFRDLWQSINGPGSWDANPWVWAVEFKRIEQERKVA
ncbi:hypothetical protein DyAD56_16125 [Dyella sp. AD56]|nr:hypothetical protein DyAD56_16125 [Dyella sp. AD56]